MTIDSATAPGGPGVLERVIRFSVRQRWLVVAGAVAIAALGAFNFTRLPIDAVPDITNVQVQINTEAPGFSRDCMNTHITIDILQKYFQRGKWNALRL
jgi:cobalt-zinc-cadmium resistance protein CzcA